MRHRLAFATKKLELITRGVAAGGLGGHDMVETSLVDARSNSWKLAIFSPSVGRFVCPEGVLWQNG